MEHGRWWVTDEGWRVLKGQATIELRKDMATGAAAKGSRRDRKAAAAADRSWAKPTPACSRP